MADSDGLHSYGLYGDGPYSYGLYRYGAYGYGRSMPTHLTEASGSCLLQWLECYNKEHVVMTSMLQQGTCCDN